MSDERGGAAACRRELPDRFGHCHRRADEACRQGTTDDDTTDTDDIEGELQRYAVTLRQIAACIEHMALRQRGPEFESRAADEKDPLGN